MRYFVLAGSLVLRLLASCNQTVETPSPEGQAQEVATLASKAPSTSQRAACLLNGIHYGWQGITKLRDGLVTECHLE